LNKHILLRKYVPTRVTGSGGKYLHRKPFRGKSFRLTFMQGAFSREFFQGNFYAGNFGILPGRLF
jgi:hypothetical protein